MAPISKPWLRKKENGSKIEEAKNISKTYSTLSKINIDIESQRVGDLFFPLNLFHYCFHTVHMNMLDYNLVVKGGIAPPINGFVKIIIQKPTGIPHRNRYYQSCQ